VRRTFDFEWFKVKWQPGYGWIFERRPAVVVAAISSDDRIWLEQIERIPTGSVSWEMPGGLIDADEDAVSAGLRELEEECGLVATRGGRLLRETCELAPGMGRFLHHIVVASGVVAKGRRPVAQKEEKILAVRRFDRAQVRRMMRSARINVLSTLGVLAVSGWLDGSPAPSRRS